jgi:hypothetical protein
LCAHDNYGAATSELFGLTQEIGGVVYEVSLVEDQHWPDSTFLCKQEIPFDTTGVEIVVEASYYKKDIEVCCEDLFCPCFAGLLADDCRLSFEYSFDRASRAERNPVAGCRPKAYGLPDAAAGCGLDFAVFSPDNKTFAMSEGHTASYAIGKGRQLLREGFTPAYRNKVHLSLPIRVMILTRGVYLRRGAKLAVENRQYQAEAKLTPKLAQVRPI